MLYYLIYVSKATAPVNDADLLAILDNARAWNEAHGITGMLLYIHGEPAVEHAGRFMQVLEGSELEVRHIFNQIKSDGRHQFVTVLNEGTLKARNFESWRMGFESIKAADICKSPGFVELNDVFLDSLSRKRFNFTVNLMKSFYGLRSTIC